MSAQSYVAYFRVSTKRQGRSGLGLEVQRLSILSFLRTFGGTILHEITEVESGRRADRPGLMRALELCRRHDATLLIAKLDRLARNVALVSRLMESDVRFLVADMPQANRLTFHIIAATAEYESRLMGERISAALFALRRRGGRLGFQLMAPDQQRRIAEMGHQTVTARCAATIERALPEIMNMRSLGMRSFRSICDGLTARGIPTALGRKVWRPRALQLGLQRYDPKLTKRLRLGGISALQSRLNGRRAIANWMRHARLHALKIAEVVKEIHASGITSHTEVAKELNRRKLRTVFDKPWKYYKVSKLIKFAKRIRGKPLPAKRTGPRFIEDSQVGTSANEFWPRYAIEREIETMISTEIESRIEALRVAQARVRSAMAEVSITATMPSFEAALGNLRSKLLEVAASLGLKPARPDMSSKSRPQIARAV